MAAALVIAGFLALTAMVVYQARHGPHRGGDSSSGSSGSDYSADSGSSDNGDSSDSGGGGSDSGDPHLGANL